MKTEPTEYSIGHLSRDKITHWDGVRNFQARNFMRDTMQVGDGVFFYHSVTDPIGIAGEAQVIKIGYPDYTAYDPDDKHYDPKSQEDRPTWFMVDVQFVRACRKIITLSQLREMPSLEGMELLRRGSRLSVQPVRPAEWNAIIKLPEWS
jgi:predicted RNA-binding protein with PUA-like domain